VSSFFRIEAVGLVRKSIQYTFEAVMRTVLPKTIALR